MTARVVYGLAVGALVGGVPFWLLGVVAEYRRAAALVATAAAVALSATAFRTPAAWALGVLAGAVVSWAAVAWVMGGNWRLLVYVVVLAARYYLAAAAALLIAWALTHGRRRTRG